MYGDFKPIISVITPLYNKERYISDCIQSVLMQSFENWEMLIVEDGSIDGSRTILESYAKKYHQKIIPLYHNDGANHGVSASRQLATKHARGDFLAYLDADDLWMPEKLTHDAHILISNPSAAAVVSRTLFWWEDGSHKAEIDNVAPTYNKLFRPKELFKYLFGGGHIKIVPPCTCSVTIRRSAIAEMSPWDNAYSVAEDVKYFSELYYKFPIFVSQHILSEYRRLHDGAWSSGLRDGTDAQAHIRLNEWLGEFPRAAELTE